jgi:hypothetical protein
MGLLFSVLATLLAPFCGCGSGLLMLTSGAGLTLSPGTASFPQGGQLGLMLLGADAYTCAWQPSDPTVVSVLAPGVIYANKPGTVQISVKCAGGSATASVTVTNPVYSAPIVITKGGTYTGRWRSTDAVTPPIMVQTDEPVVIKDSVVMGPNFLIMGYGGAQGIHLTVQNVIGVAQPNLVAGQPNGIFVYIEKGASLNVNHCTMNSVSSGIYLGGGTYSSLSITNNVATDMDDRQSNGQGGMTDQLGTLGHFVLFDGVSAPNGATIAWNQVVDQPGVSSVEDIINMFASAGGSNDNPISIHDNYLEGAINDIGATYAGGGITTDSGTTRSATAFVSIDSNQVVITQNTGIFVASGHNVSVTNNRVVSSGIDSAGTWMEVPGAPGYAYLMQNFYNSSQYYANTFSGNYAGKTRLSAASTPMRADLSTPDASTTLGNSVTQMQYAVQASDPSAVTRASEQAEREYWYAKVGAANTTIGASLTP